MVKEQILTDVPGYEGQEIVIKRMNYGEKSEFAGITTNVKIVRGQEDVAIDMEKTRIYTLLFGIKSAPFFVMADRSSRLNSINNLDDETGTYLLMKIKELNDSSLTDEIKKKSNMQLREEESPPQE